MIFQPWTHLPSPKPYENLSQPPITITITIRDQPTPHHAGSATHQPMQSLSTGFPESIMQSIGQPDQRIAYRSIMQSISQPDQPCNRTASQIRPCNDRSVWDSLIWLADRLHDRFRDRDRQQIVDPVKPRPMSPGREP